MSPLKKLGFLWAFSLPLVIVGTYQVGGPVWTWAAVGYTFVLIPLLDVGFGRNHRNLDRPGYDAALSDRYFDVLVYAYVYGHVALLLWGAYVLTFEPLTGWQQTGLIMSIGIMAGTVINAAHELGHRSSRVAQLHAQAVLALVSYGHFFIEHNRGHHVHVATPLDPATSRKNQTLYAFWVQSIVGGYRSAWRIETALLRKDNRPLRSRHNRMLWFAAWPVVLATLLTVGFSLWAGRVVWLVPVLFAGQSWLGILLLECINYVEHYGIVRRELPRVQGQPVRYERVNPLHSWNASERISNYVLFQLQRHSDHHAYASRPYQVLRHFEQSPQLPGGYPAMILLALVPPLWFAVMNPRLERWWQQAHQPDQIAAVVRLFA